MSPCSHSVRAAGLAAMSRESEEVAREEGRSLQGRHERDRGRACDSGVVTIKRLALSNHLHQLTVCIFLYRPFPLGISGLVGWEAKVSLSLLSCAVPSCW